MLQRVSVTRRGGDTRAPSFPLCMCAMAKPCEDTARNLQAREDSPGTESSGTVIQDSVAFQNCEKYISVV